MMDAGFFNSYIKKIGLATHDEKDKLLADSMEMTLSLIMNLTQSRHGMINQMNIGNIKSQDKLEYYLVALINSTMTIIELMEYIKKCRSILKLNEIKWDDFDYYLESIKKECADIMK